MSSIFTAGGSADAIPIWFVTAASYAEVRERLDAPARAFADAAGFEPKAGQHLLLPGKAGIGGVLFGLEAADDAKDLFLAGRLPQHLPAGIFRFANDPHDARLAALGFALGCLRASRATASRKGARVKLDPPQGVDRDDLARVVAGGDAGARPDQYAGERHGTGASSRRPRARSRHAIGATSA